MALPFMPKIIPFDKRRHNRGAFLCGKAQLDNYIQKQASQDQKRNTAAIFVLEGKNGSDIEVFYSLSSLSIDAGDLTEVAAKGLPQKRPVPCTLLGQFAVHEKWRGQGVGGWLLGHILHEVLDHAERVGSFALIVDAVDDDARSYWLYCGFIPFPDSPDRLFLPMKIIRQLLVE